MLLRYTISIRWSHITGAPRGHKADDNSYEREEDRHRKEDEEEALEPHCEGISEGRSIALRLLLVMDGDIIRVEIELRRAAVAAVVILANLCGTRATTLGTFQSFDMRGHPND